MQYTRQEMKDILEHKFLLNPEAFSSGRTNDDVVDSMILCFALEEEWTELFAKWVDNYTITTQAGQEYIRHKPIGIGPQYSSALWPEKEGEIKRILEHYQRVNKWLLDKEANGYTRGLDENEHNEILNYLINY